jgi:hypothetical protein
MASNVFVRSNTEIVSSYPTQGMDVSVRLCCFYVVLRVGSGLARGRRPSKESYRQCIDQAIEKASKVQKDCRAKDRQIDKQIITTMLVSNLHSVE